jgi:hypothetical protein
MARPSTILALLVALAAAVKIAGAGGPPNKEVIIRGELQNDDEKDTKRKQPCKVHKVRLRAGRSYNILLVGVGFDAYLRLEDDAGKPLAEDDDSGGNLNALIKFDCPETGDYRIICTRVGRRSGSYVLTLRAQPPKGLPAWFVELDTDGDGQVSLKEWYKAGKPLDEFLKLDRNGDGYLTEDEIKFAIEAGLLPTPKP